MVKLFIKDNTSGRVHEYGTDRHDSLVLEGNALHYYNLQTGCGTQYPDEGYSFCNEDGSIPKWDLEYGVEPYIDIGGVTADVPDTDFGKWIPVSERLPENPMERVLVKLKDDRYVTGSPAMDTDRFRDGTWARWFNSVTHWMPLPEPPEE